MVEKKRRTWLWVIGWIFFFPITLSILILRNKKMSNETKYAIVSGIWVLLLFLGLMSSCTSGRKTDGPASEPSAKEQTADPASETEERPADKSAERSTEETTKEPTVESVEEPDDKSAEKPAEKAPTSPSYELEAGVANEYSTTYTHNDGNGNLAVRDAFAIPAGTYTVKNLGEYRAQVNAYSTDSSIMTDVNIVMVDPGETATLEVPEGYVVYLTEPTHVLLTPQG